MSKLLEIFGKAITVNVADLIWHWINAVKANAIRPSYQQEFDEILDLISQMELAEAEQKLRFYLFENPSCTAGRMAAAAICIHKNCIKEAANELNSVYMREPANTIALYSLGNCYERMGLEAEAIEFYQDALKFKNYLELPRKRLAAIYYKNGQIDRVIEEYEQILNETPDDITSLVLLGYLYIAKSDYGTAVDKFNRAILIHPDNFHMDEFDDVDSMIAECDFERAQQTLENLIEQDSDRAELYVKLGDVQALLGNDSDAITNYERALALEPGCLEATVKLGTCNMRSGRLWAACKLFTAAMEINDEIIDAYVGLAAGNALMGKTRQAADTLSLAAAISPNSAILFTQAAMLQTRLAFGSGDPQQGDCEPQQMPDQNALSKAVFHQHAAVLETQPNSADAHYRMGICLSKAGELNDAVIQFRQALEINPAFYRAKVKLAVCLFETGENEQALDLLKENPSLTADELHLYYKTAVLFSSKSLFTRARENLQKFLSSNYAQADAAQNISNVLQNLGLIDRASAMLECLAQNSSDEEN